MKSIVTRFASSLHECNQVIKRFSFLCANRKQLNPTMATSLEINGLNPNKRQINTEPSVNKKLCTKDDESISQERVRRRKMAILMSYSGQGYFGMQRNPGCVTIEEDLLNALLKADIINEEAFNQVQLMQFQRAARTDKGVSAVRQVVSAKLAEGCTPELINAHLPEKIRVFAIKRTTKGFNSKSSCDARTYSYVMPTYAFAPGATEELNEDYRISDEVISEINKVLKVFVGTHNFHNFTSRKKFQDPSAIRYMINFECEKPFISNNVEFIVLKVKGQSFMLHQIRKMVGLAIAIVKGLTSSDTIEKAYGEERIDIPVAPSLGLMLEEVHYSRYNEKFGKDGMHENLTWSEVNEEVEKFKQEHIFPSIIAAELSEKSMHNWLVTLPLHSYDIRKYEERSFDEGSSNSAPADLMELHRSSTDV